MKKLKDETMINELDLLCESVRTFVMEGKFETCIELICQAMHHYPHSPQPHNLLGIICEKCGDHKQAMQHFRAAWALDPSYLPANHNLSASGTMFKNPNYAFDESDLDMHTYHNYEIVKDAKGIRHMMNKNKIEYDCFGIGRVVRSKK